MSKNHKIYPLLSPYLIYHVPGTVEGPQVCRRGGVVGEGG